MIQRERQMIERQMIERDRETEREREASPGGA